MQVPFDISSAQLLQKGKGKRERTSRGTATKESPEIRESPDIFNASAEAVKNKILCILSSLNKLHFHSSNTSDTSHFRLQLLNVCLNILKTVNGEENQKTFPSCKKKVALSCSDLLFIYPFSYIKAEPLSKQDRSLKCFICAQTSKLMLTLL